MATEIGHYVGNKRVAGTSGRAGDVTNPATGEVTAKVAFASEAEIDAAVQVAKKAQLAWAATPPLRRQRVMFNLKSLIEKRTDDLARLMSLEHGKTFDDAKGEVGRGLEVVEFSCAIAHHMQRRLHRAGRLGHGHLVDPPAARRGGGHHAVQLPDHDPVLDGRHGGGLRQRLHPEAVGEGPQRADAAGRAVRRGGRAGRHLPGAERRQGRGRCAAQASRRAGDLLRRLDGDRRVRLSHRARSATNACRRCAAPRTTW